MKRSLLILSVTLVINVITEHYVTAAFGGFFGGNKYSLTENIVIGRIDQQEDLFGSMVAIGDCGKELGYDVFVQATEVSFRKKYGLGFENLEYIKIKFDYKSRDQVNISIRGVENRRTAQEIFDEIKPKILEKINEYKSGPVVPAQKLPDYTTPESDFIAAEFDILASEFRDTLYGKYVYLDGVFYGTQYTADYLQPLEASYAKLGKKNVVLFATFKLGNEKSKMVTVGYPYVQREDGMQLLKLNAMDKVRVYGYVPAPSMKTVTLRDGRSRGKFYPKDSGGKDNCWPAIQDYGMCAENFILMIKVVPQTK